MKKTIKMLAIFFLIIILLIFCSCKEKNAISHTSSDPLTTESTNLTADNQLVTDAERTSVLLRTVTASDDLDNVKSIAILDETCIVLSTLIDKEDMEFLQKYTYSHYRTDKRENWDEWLKNNSVLCLNVDTKTCGVSSLYLMQDGSIAIQQMCGDSEVPEISYDFYIADEEDKLTKEKLENF